MPDLITHAAGAYLARRGFGLTGYAVLLYLGVMLPDLLSRPLHILFPRYTWAAAAFHSPAGVFLACWLIALFFREDQRRRVFCFLFGGGMLHELMDLGQKHLVGGYRWFFPFSKKEFSLGFFWPEDSVRVLPYTIILVLIVYLLGYLRRKPNTAPGSNP